MANQQDLPPVPYQTPVIDKQGLLTGPWSGWFRQLFFRVGGNVASSLSQALINPMTALGDLVFGVASGAPSRLAGNVSTTREFLTQTGTGTASTAPVWATIQVSDVPALPYVTSVGLSLPAIFTVSGSPVTASGALTGALANQSANLVWAGPSTGAAAAPTFRALVGADLPNPSASSLGGVQSAAAVPHQWVDSISTGGVPHLSQPAFTDVSGVATTAQLPTIPITLGGTGQGTAVLGFNALSPNTTLGDVTYFDGTNNVRLAGNTTTTKKFLTQTGTGTASAAPAWATIAAADVPTLNQNTTGTAANVTGVVALVNGGTGTAAASAGAALNALLPTQTANAGKFLKTDGTNASWAAATGPTAPTIQRFTSGSGTYTTPTSPIPLYILVRALGAGSGGWGSGSTTFATGSNGGASTFGTSFLSAGGGSGSTNVTSGGAGGTNSIGAGATTIINAPGGAGAAAPAATSGVNPVAGIGGSSLLGGAGLAGQVTTGTGGAGAANTGGGGGGGGATGSAQAGSGGGSGGYLEVIITSPSATYAYSVGAGGSGGAGSAGGATGGAGGSGMIEITEFYQ